MSKDDPLESNRRPAATMWLEPESMAEARENFYHRFLQLAPAEIAHPMHPLSPHDVWVISWAAAVAAFSYLQEGRTAP